MEYYPVIYTRTYQVDFYRPFHVCPDFVNVDVVYPYIEQVLKEYYVNDGQFRQIVLSNSEYCIFGNTCYIEKMAEYDENISNYTKDNGGRAIYGFFGFAARMQPYETIPSFSLKNCTDAFIKYMIPVWNESIQQTQLPESVQLPEKPYISSDKPEPEEVILNCSFFTEAEGLFDKMLFEAFCNQKQLSYCSSINDYQVLRQMKFTNAVTSHDNILRLKQGVAEYIRQTEKKEPVVNEKESAFQRIFRNLFQKG